MQVVRSVVDDRNKFDVRKGLDRAWGQWLLWETAGISLTPSSRLWEGYWMGQGRMNEGTEVGRGAALRYVPT